MRLRMAAIAAAIFLCVVNVTTAQNGQELFQQGLLKERGERDIQGAIPIYEKVVREFSSNRALAARALLQLGKVHDALGKSQARQYYDQVLKDYPDQTEIRAEAERRRKALDIAHNGSTPVPDRMIWQNPPLSELDGSVSGDGAYLAFIDRSPGGGLMLRDLKKGETRRLAANTLGEASSPAISRDGRRVAYSRYDTVSGQSELHVVDVDSGADRILHANGNLRYLPRGWTATGQILTIFSLKSGGYQIAMVNASGGLTDVLKTFLRYEEPRNLTLSPDGRFIAYDYPQDKNSAARDIFVLGVSGGGSREYELGHDEAHDYVLGWMPDSKWLLFGSDRGGKSGIWSIETSEGKSTATPPLRVRDSSGEIRPLGTTSSASLVYSPAARTGEVRILEGLQPELARLQLSALQRSQPPQDLSTASIEGVIVKLGTNEPIPGADLELIRREGTADAPLFPGFAEALSAFTAPNVQGPRLSNSTPPALSPEIQYVRSGDDGKFVFRNLKPGKYRLVAALADGAYHPAEYGQRDPRGNGMLLPVAQGQSVKDIRMEMALTGVITGRIFDGNGEPVAHAPVLAVFTVPLPLPIPFTAQVVLTDELGYYRLFWLPPGQYIVAATMVDADRRSLPTFVSLPGRTTFLAAERMGNAPIRRSLPEGNLIEEATRAVYYGDVIDLEQARPIDLRSGGHVSGVDINVGVGRTEGRHVRGVVINGATGQRAAGVTVTVMPLAAPIGNGASTGTTDSTGAFDIPGIFRGRYAVFTQYLRNAATTPSTAGAIVGPADTTIAYAIPIEVGNANIESLSLVTVPPVNTKGRVIIEGRQPLEAAAELRKIRIAMVRIPGWAAQASSVPPGGGTGNGIVDERGAFTVWTSPGLWDINLPQLPANAYVKSIRSGQYDARRNGPVLITDPAIDPIEIVIGTDAGEVRGFAVGSNGPMGNVSVELVPTLKDHPNNTRTAITELDGRFRINGVPPGGYKIFAWEYKGPWADPQTYEASGKLIYVSEGTTQDVQVTVIPKPR